MHYTKADVVVMVQKAAEGRMDFIYNPGNTKPTCVYVAGHKRAGEWGDGWDLSEAKPDCLIGCALIGAGVVTMLEILDGDSNDATVGYLTADMEGHTFDDDAVDFMARVQEKQDRGFSWSEAIQYGLTGRTN